jgi:hypothetical protein
MADSLEIGLIKRTNNKTDRSRRIAPKKAKPKRCTPKNKQLQETFKKALITKSSIISLKWIFPENLFQTIKADMVVSIKIIVQAKLIMEPGGVKVGRFIVLYHSIPPEVIQPPTLATKTAIKGIKI